VAATRAEHTEARRAARREEALEVASPG
jgi:hypothetical protein